MKKIGITGGIGSGKSIISKIIEVIGFPVFYSDQVAKEIISSNTPAKNQITELFGKNAFIQGKLNRKFIAQQIFTNPELKKNIDSIVHPLLRQEFQRWSEKQETPLVFNEAAILFETGAYKKFDATVLVIANKELRIQRVVERDHCSNEDVLNRMNNQWEDDQKIKLASYIIENNEDSKLIDQIEVIIAKLQD